MRVLKTLVVLGAVAVGLLALSSEAQAQPWRVRYGYNYPAPYYSPGYYPRVASYYYGGVNPYPVYPPGYYYGTGAVYAYPGYAPVYTGSHYYGVGTPYYGGGFYYYRR